ncbi:unnamed protein product [Durusdinium trenchii]|uniref:Uncharacterized protein n=1 Tax=Durusdinium trenchii TaxID=1381693 RepID=A0ABP0PSH4_9DINO
MTWRTGCSFLVQTSPAFVREDFCYDHRLRKSLLSSLPSSDASGLDAGLQPQPCELLGMSGHTAEALGPLVLQIGGMRKSLRANDVVHVTVLNLRERRIFQPTLHPESLKPLQRMRHASCVVRCSFLPASAYGGCVLVLGGHDANTHASRLGLPRPAMRRLMFLQVTQSDGSEIRWLERQAFGTIPEYMYNLQCVSFSGGEKVCVFGGDVPTFEDEYERIQDRTCCFFVYVLELASCTWSAVKTTGSAPDWRSFHAAVGHTSFLDGKDYLITFGGTAEHCEPLAGGHLADMRGYQLDLHDFKWLGGPTENLPAPRLRFGAARYGRHLLIHGGHGGVLTSGNGYVARMNLHTLRWCQPTRWGRLNFSNAAPPLAAGAFETGTPEAGLVLGGAQQTLGGPRILQRLVVLRLRDVSVERDGELPEGESHVATGDGGDDEDDLTHVQLQIRNAQGRHRVVTMPMALLAALRRDTASAEGLLQLLQHLNQDREEPEPD